MASSPPTAIPPSTETVETAADGTTIKTSEYVRPDGGKIVVIERIDPRGVSTVETMEYPASFPPPTSHTPVPELTGKDVTTDTRPDGTSVVTTILRYSNGTSHVIEEETRPDGAKVVTETKVPAGGVVGGGLGPPATTTAPMQPGPPVHGMTFPPNDPYRYGGNGAAPTTTFLPTANPTVYVPQYGTSAVPGQAQGGQYPNASHPTQQPYKSAGPPDQNQSSSAASSPGQGDTGTSSTGKDPFCSRTRNKILVGVVAVLAIIGAVIGALFGTGTISTGSTAAISSRGASSGNSTTGVPVEPSPSPPPQASPTASPVGPSFPTMSVGYAVIWAGIIPDEGGCERPTPGIYASCGPGGAAVLLHEAEEGQCKEIVAQGAITCRYSNFGTTDSSLMGFACVGSTLEALAANVDIIEDGSVPCPVGAPAGYAVFLAQDCADESELIWNSMQCDPPDAVLVDDEGDFFCLVQSSCPLGEDCNLSIPSLSASVPASAITDGCAQDI